MGKKERGIKDSRSVAGSGPRTRGERTHVMRQKSFALKGSRSLRGLVWEETGYGSEVHNSEQGQGSDSGLS